MNYTQALRVLAGRPESYMRLGLTRMRRHLKALGDPQESFLSLHVAGTNGKGSVCAMLEAALRAGGERVGLYTSPHLSDVRERIRVDGRPIPKGEFGRVMSFVLRRERDPLTYFELVTAMAFVHFKRRGVRWAVLETGMGGRLDATNVIRRPAASVIPAIDYDHTQWLGSDLASIAREKAGIFKRGRPAIVAERKPRALAALRRWARLRGASFRVSRPRWRRVRIDWKRGRQFLEGRQGRVAIGVLGASQPANAALVLDVLAELRRRGYPIPSGACNGLARLRWPGRFEVLRRGRKTAILDGAHNPQAIRHFCRTLDASPWAARPKRFLLGMLRDKPYERMLRLLAPRLSEAVCSKPPSPRALEPVELARSLRCAAPKADIWVVPDVREAVSAWLKSRSPATLCVCGSFYLVGAAREVLEGP